MIADDALPSTGLIAPGSMVRYAVRATLPEPSATPALLTDLRRAFPDQGWRIRDPHDAAPGVTRFIDQTTLFMTLVGLTSLLVGGLGVANGVRAWLDARARTIAVLRCLGSSSALVLAVCLIQVLALAVGGVIIGVTAGALAPIALAAWLKEVLPVPPVLGLYPGPLLLAAGYGLLDRAGILALAARTRGAHPGRALFRDALMPERTRPSVGCSQSTPRGGWPGRADHCHRDRPPLRVVVLRRRPRDAGPVPSGRIAVMRRPGPARVGRPSGAAGPRQPLPARARRRR